MQGREEAIYIAKVCFYDLLHKIQGLVIQRNRDCEFQTC